MEGMNENHLKRILHRRSDLSSVFLRFMFTFFVNRRMSAEAKALLDDGRLDVEGLVEFVARTLRSDERIGPLDWVLDHSIVKNVTKVCKNCRKDYSQVFWTCDMCNGECCSFCNRWAHTCTTTGGCGVSICSPCQKSDESLSLQFWPCQCTDAYGNPPLRCTKCILSDQVCARYGVRRDRDWTNDEFCGANQLCRGCEYAGLCLDCNHDQDIDVIDILFRRSDSDDWPCVMRCLTGVP